MSQATSKHQPAKHRTGTIAIVGNPNAGKTTLFNALTGSRQKVGNYPGVTVERVSAKRKLGSHTVEFFDVPGLYSLEAVSADEQVAVEALTGQGVPAPDLVVCVIDSTNLERNLYLFTQITELGLPTIVVLTMEDVLRSKGLQVDLVRLSELLGTQVISVVAHKGAGVKDLEAKIAQLLDEGELMAPAPWKAANSSAVLVAIKERAARSGIDLEEEELSYMLGASIEDVSATWHGHPDLLSFLQEVLTPSAGSNVAARYEWTSNVQRQTVIRVSEKSGPTITDRLDRILTHRFWGLGVFVAIMYFVFLSIYSFAEPIMSLIEGSIGSLGDWVGSFFPQNELLRSLLVDGVIGGVGAALVFLPQITILFFFISVLEGTGYLSRAAFLMDKLLGWAGLNGRAFIPLLSSFACAIPGIMAARVMPDPKSRLATILVAPLMSCSARLPVYLLLIGAVIAPTYGGAWAGFTLFAMHFLGLAVAIPVVLVINRKILRGKRLPFHLELPPYQWPKWRDVWLSMWIRAKTFLQTAGTIIFVMSIAIWALLYFPRSNEEAAKFAQDYQSQHSQATPESVQQYVKARQMEASYLGRFGHAIEPVFEPAGFDWRLSTAILSAFPAREVVVASMSVLFEQNAEAAEESPSLRKAVQDASWPDGRKLITPWSAASLMVFFALCCQCMATLATVRRETGSWKWSLFMFSYMTVLAYVFAVAIFQLGTLFS